MDGHQVTDFPAGLGEFLLQELIELIETVHSPVLPSPHLTEVATQLNKVSISFLFGDPLPGQIARDTLRRHKYWRQTGQSKPSMVSVTIW